MLIDEALWIDFIDFNCQMLLRTSDGKREKFVNHKAMTLFKMTNKLETEIISNKSFRVSWGMELGFLQEKSYHLRTISKRNFVHCPVLDFADDCWNSQSCYRINEFYLRRRVGYIHSLIGWFLPIWGRVTNIAILQSFYYWSYNNLNKMVNYFIVR